MPRQIYALPRHGIDILLSIDDWYCNYGCWSNRLHRLPRMSRPFAEVHVRERIWSGRGKEDCYCGPI